MHHLRSWPWFLLAVAARLPLSTPAQDSTAAPAGEKAAPAPSSENRDPHGPRKLEGYIRALEGSARDEHQKPEEVVRALRLRPTDTVADLGCGPGYFTLRLARAVPHGVVYAVDIEPRMLDRVNEKITASGASNVVPVLATSSDTRLPPARLDTILVVDAYHHFDDRVAYLRRLARVLRPGGHLAVVDYYKRKLPVGPPPPHKLAKDVVLRECKEAGLQLVEEPDFLPYQYFLIWEKAPEKEES